MTEKAARLLDDDARQMLAGLKGALAGLSDWSESDLEAAVRGFAAGQELGLGKVAQPLRAALTGSTVSPGIFEVMAVLGREECRGRLDDAIAG